LNKEILVVAFHDERRGLGLGRRKVTSEKELNPKVLPKATDVLGVAEELLGFDRVMGRCQDGPRVSAESAER